jgi:hypothetical protein
MMRQGLILSLAAAACVAALIARKPKPARVNSAALHRAACPEWSARHAIAAERVALFGSLWSDVANLCRVPASYGPQPQAAFGAVLKYAQPLAATPDTGRVIAFEPARQAAALRVRKSVAFKPYIPVSEKQAA